MNPGLFNYSRPQWLLVRTLPPEEVDIMIAALTQQSTHIVSAVGGDCCLSADRWGGLYAAPERHFSVWGNIGLSGDNRGGVGGGASVEGKVHSLTDSQLVPNESVQWRAKGEFVQPDGAGSRTPQTQTQRVRTGNPLGWPVPDLLQTPSPAPRSSTADTSWCRHPTATRRRAGGEAAGLSDMILTRWTGRGARRTGTVRSAPGAWASTPLWPACLTACPWPTGGSLHSDQAREGEPTSDQFSCF